MATGGVPGRKEEDFRYTCTLCMEPYRGRSPKILPCFHSFCLPCLTALEASVTLSAAEGSKPEDEAKREGEDDQQADSGATEGEDDQQADSGATEEEEKNESCCTGEEKSDVTEQNDAIGVIQTGPGRTFLCPTCRALVAVPEGGVAFLQTNFYVDHEPQAEEAPPHPPLCGMCDEGNQEPATDTCHDCPSHMCRMCRRYHDKFMANHNVTPLSFNHPEKKKEERKTMCLVHRDQALCLWCRQCHVSICLHCKFSSHEGHDTVDLAKAVLEAREEVRSLVASAQQQIHVVRSSLRSMDRKERQLTGHVQEVTRKVHARFDQLMAWGQRSRDQLLDAVSCKEDAEKSQLESDKSVMTATTDILSSLISHVAQSAGNDSDVLLLQSELKAGLLSDDKLDHHRQQAEIQDTVWSWTYEDTDRTSVLQASDVQAYMGSLMDGSVTDDNKRVSFQEVTEKMDRLLTFMTETTITMSTLTKQEAGLKNKVTSLEKMSASLAEDMNSTKKKAADQTMKINRDVLLLQRSETEMKTTTSVLTEKFDRLCFQLRC